MLRVCRRKTTGEITQLYEDYEYSLIFLSDSRASEGGRESP